MSNATNGKKFRLRFTDKVSVADARRCSDLSHRQRSDDDEVGKPLYSFRVDGVSPQHDTVHMDDDGVIHIRERKRRQTTDTERVSEGVFAVEPEQLKTVRDVGDAELRARVHQALTEQRKKLKSAGDINKSNAEYWARGGG